MLLKRLILKNIRSYVDEVFDFPQGSLLLTGDIGAGKTTILLAIEFAFFGLMKGDISGESLLRHGAKEGSVTLTFELDGKEISITRRLKKKNDAIMQDFGTITSDGSLIDATAVELRSKVLELLGYPQELVTKNPSIIYRYTIYTPQEEMKSILFESAETRMDILRKIFNIDKYKRIRENTLAYAKELRTHKKILESKISDLDEIKTTHEALVQRQTVLRTAYEKEVSLTKEAQEQAAKIKVHVEEHTQEIEAYQKQKSVYTIASMQLQHEGQELERLQKELNIVQYRISEYAKRLEELTTIDIDEVELAKNLIDAEEKLTKIRSAREVIKNRLESKSDDLKNISIESSAELSARLAFIATRLESKTKEESALEQTQEERMRIATELTTLILTKNASAKIVNTLKDLNTCPVCMQNVDFTHKITITDREQLAIAGANRKIVQSEEKQRNVDKEIVILKAHIEELRLFELEKTTLEARLAQVTTRLEQKQLLEKEIEELRQKQQKLDAMDTGKIIDYISKHRKVLASFQLKKNIRESLNEKQVQEKDLTQKITISSDKVSQMVREQKILEDAISAKIPLEAMYKALKEKYEIALASFQKAELQLLSTRKDLEQVNAECLRLEESIVIKEQVKQKIAYIGELNHWLTEHFINISSTIEKAIMQRIHREFDELFRTWLDILLEDEHIDVHIDEEFTPLITQNGFSTSIANLSGGEKTSVALAYRLALNKAINDFMNTIKTKDILILDEPTDGFSSEQLDKMKEVLDELACPQLIVVSHEAKMESYMQHIIRINKHEHTSSKT
ncbi:MAG: SMC family ATPase [Candidatus Woesearchaeota archaeon]